VSALVSFIGRSFSKNSRPACGPATTRRLPGHRPRPFRSGYAHLDGDPEAHSTWFLDTHRRVRHERARLRLGLACHGPSAQHRRHCDLLAPDPLQRRRARRDSHAPTVTAPEIALPRHLRPCPPRARSIGIWRSLAVLFPPSSPATFGQKAQVAASAWRSLTRKRSRFKPCRAHHVQPQVGSDPKIRPLAS
jgi:hypothetical protein